MGEASSLTSSSSLLHQEQLYRLNDNGSKAVKSYSPLLLMCFENTILLLLSSSFSTFFLKCIYNADNYLGVSRIAPALQLQLLYIYLRGLF
jgi:hypothetical protein